MAWMTYTFKNLKTDEIYEEMIKQSELEEYCHTFGVERVLSRPLVVSGLDKKPDRGFRDVLNRIKKANIRSTIDDF